eukprot:4462775-Prymnesium_polylepis.1
MQKRARADGPREVLCTKLRAPAQLALKNGEKLSELEDQLLDDYEREESLAMWREERKRQEEWEQARQERLRVESEREAARRAAET